MEENSSRPKSIVKPEDFGVEESEDLARYVKLDALCRARNDYFGFLASLAGIQITGVARQRGGYGPYPGDALRRDDGGSPTLQRPLIFRNVLQSLGYLRSHVEQKLREGLPASLSTAFHLSAPPEISEIDLGYGIVRYYSSFEHLSESLRTMGEDIDDLCRRFQVGVNECVQEIDKFLGYKARLEQEGTRSFESSTSRSGDAPAGPSQTTVVNLNLGQPAELQGGDARSAAKTITEDSGHDVTGFEIDGLEDLHLDLLEAMYTLGARSKRERRPQRDIAPKAVGGSDEDIKTPMAQLSKWRLTESISGRSGGCWLTERGIQVLSRRRPDVVPEVRIP